MTDGQFPTSPAVRLSEARGKIAAISGSALFSTVYVSFTIDTFVEESQKPQGKVFAGVQVLMIIIASVGLVPWTDWIDSQITFRGTSIRSVLELNMQRALGALVYAQSLLYIVLLTWFIVKAGGPIASPYSVILLTASVLSAAVARRPIPVLIISGLACAGYIIGIPLYRGLEDPVTKTAPDWLVVLTALLSVIISIIIELIRQAALERRERRQQTAVDVTQPGLEEKGSDTPQ